MAKPFLIAVLVGSLRKESFNLKIAKALIKLAPDALKLEIVPLHDLSFFNADREATSPPDWLALRERVQQSNGVLFVTPEYLRSTSGVLKNAIDVGSQPNNQSSFLGKPVGIVCGVPGPQPGLSAVRHLRDMLQGIAGEIMEQPEANPTSIGGIFNDKGEVVNESVNAMLKQFIDAYAAFVAAQNK